MRTEVTTKIDVRDDRERVLRVLADLGAAYHPDREVWTFVHESAGPMPEDIAQYFFGSRGLAIQSVRPLDPEPEPDEEAERLLAELDESRAREATDRTDSDWHRVGDRWVRSD